MTKEEVKAAIAEKIAGQGNQLDLSGSLDTILGAIVDLIPDAYTLPVANADTLGGVKVGSGLGINANGVLNADSQHCVAYVEVNPTNHTVTLLENSPAKAPDIRAALVAGIPVVGVSFNRGGNDVQTTWLCSGLSLDDAMASAVFFLVYIYDTPATLSYGVLPV